MNNIYGKNDWRNLEQGEENCFLLTNGLGGFSSLTLIGSNARNDHAVLMGALQAPSKRYHLVSNVKMRVCERDKAYLLYSQSYTDSQDNAEGYQYLQCFDQNYYPRWQYHAGGTDIVQTMMMLQNDNTVILNYEIESDTDGEMILTPLYQFVPKGQLLEKNQKFSIDDRKIISNNTVLYYWSNGSSRLHETVWDEERYYRLDECDGRDHVGRSVSLHDISIPFSKGKQTLYIVFSTNDQYQPDVNWVRMQFQNEVRRQKQLIKMSGINHPVGQQLVKSANQYLTWRMSTDGQSIIAGYPFFGDWGRDTLIAMIGCTLTTGQYDAAKSILETFMKYCDHGLMPNMFPENGADPIYNTVDAALLFFEAVYIYYQKTDDKKFVEQTWPVMNNIITAYVHGTDFAIKMDEDGLIQAGQKLDQLTWMDVRYQDILPTPRHGKPVEINAYWYNALRIMEEFSAFREPDQKELYHRMAEKTKLSFIQKFWDEDMHCLKDVLGETSEEKQIRCNQVWALSMSFVMLDQWQADCVLETIKRYLYTPWGLRSLSYEDDAYHPNYGGPQKLRDMAYHQGTVWAFPLGAYYRACLRFADNLQDTIDETRLKLLSIEACLREGCVGHIAEIYDGNEQHTSRGCFAQAWSVGEILRVYEMIEKLERDTKDAD